ncbi:MAG: HD domain-containing protein [Desulfovibrio sp.]|nr:HD domain-containing protein [Desulfovibrio sp.]
MLRKTPRTGWAFLGTNSENVAEHSFRTTILGFLLAKMAGVDCAKVVELCLFHDLHEARTGDFNYLYHRYNSTRAREALREALAGTGLAEELLGCFDEFSEKRSYEAKLANDADQLDLIANLNVELSKGNEFAREWLDSALPRLETREGRFLAQALLERDPNVWWYGQVPKSWWVHHK